MMLVDSIPPLVFASISSLLLFFQHVKKKYQIIFDQDINVFDQNDDVVENDRFPSIFKRNIIKFSLCLSQTGFYAFLLGWKFAQINDNYGDDYKDGKIGDDDDKSLVYLFLMLLCWVNNDNNLQKSKNNNNKNKK